MTHTFHTPALRTAAIAAVLLGTTACSQITDTASSADASAEASAVCEVADCTAVTVENTVDGDTLDVSTADGQALRVRVLGIDTPETVHPDREVECMGPEASDATAQWVDDADTVNLATDDQADSQDDYGRTLAHLVTDDGDNLAADLLDAGLATRTNFSHSLNDEYAAIEDTARTDGAGLWGQC